MSKFSKFSADWAAVIVAVIGLLVTADSLNASRICEFRSKIADELSSLTVEYQNHIFNELLAPDYCIEITGTQIFNVKLRKSNIHIQDKEITEKIEAARKKQLQMENFLQNKELLFINSLKSSDLESKNFSGGALALHLNFNKFMRSQDDYFRCDRVPNYHLAQSQTNDFLNELLSIHSKCFSESYFQQIIHLGWQIAKLIIIGIFIFVMLLLWKLWRLGNEGNR